MKTYLEERIEWFDDNYRNGNALISDKQFDQLEKNLLRTNPNCDYFKKKNKLVLPSLEKDSLDEFLKGLLADTRLLIEPKIDGCAVALQYNDGNLEKAISRKGTDITSKLLKVQDIPNPLPLRGVLQVRGELYVPNQSPNFSQRIASGFLRAKEGFSERLSFCAFQIINSTLNQYESKESF
jgi:DNA ligase (NAD+)